MAENDTGLEDESGLPGGMPHASFLMLVAGLSTQVMMNLGEIRNPVTGQTARNLEHAKYNIDLLEVLKAKTEGNLSEDEARAIDMALYESRMRYVQASRGGK
jgi:CheY-specific phosphatase CheX